jgi:uncharacterized tellurite resistance protein B-like protein
VSLHLDASDFSAMDDTQRVAVLEAMIAGMIADDRITPAEARRFDEIVLALPWGVDHAVLTAMIEGAKDRLVALKKEEVQAYVEALAAKLPSPELRDKVVFTMATLMLADGELAQIEKNVLGLFVLSFGISAERALQIREALHIVPKSPPIAKPTEPETN